MGAYKKTLQWLFSQLPMYQRVGKAAYKADLNNTLKISAVLGNPEKHFKSIHIAGTNGKGSVSHMLASIFQEAGYKTGLYTSPHLLDFRERIKINGKKITKKWVVEFVDKHKSTFSEMQLSFFEMTVAMAFTYFNEEKVDIAIIETGLGGRLDSTNIINPELSIITNVSFDHTQLLGDTLQKIALEKAGIIKQNTPIVLGATEKEVEIVIQMVAKKLEAPLYKADDGLNTYELDLKGAYQQLNSKTVLTALSILQKQFNIKDENLTNGFKKTIKNTGLYGRWQTLQTMPLTICDIAHNTAATRIVVEQMQALPIDKWHIVLGVVNDKDIDAMLTLLPKQAVYYFCAAKIPRALSGIDLQNKADKFNLRGEAYKSVKKAIKVAQKRTQNNEAVYIGGSAFVVAEALAFFHKKNKL